MHADMSIITSPSNVSRQTNFDRLVEEAANCVKCPALCDRAAVLSELNGSVNARVMFIGEAPGRKGADRTRIPFSGDQSGKNFERFLESTELKRSAIFITSAALCNPQSATGANRRPTSAEIRNCSTYLQRTIALVDPEVVVPLGNAALEAIKLIQHHEFTLKNDAAKLRRWNRRLLIPLYHPSPQVLITCRDERAQLRDYKVVARAMRRVSSNLAGVE
ncbi:MAG: uracil-DNA glycosylase [Pyrinomonadaceae bacterium]